MSTPTDLIEGLKIIFRYASAEELIDHCFQAEHDQIWCCSYSGDKMTEGELSIMNDFGWFEDEDAWSMFT